MVKKNFIKENTWIKKKSIQKRFSTSLFIREMQTKNLIRYHLDPTRALNCKDQWHAVWEKVHSWNSPTATNHLRNGVKVLRKLDMHLQFDPTISFHSIYITWKSMFKMFGFDYLLKPHSHSSELKRTSMPVNWWTKKEKLCYIH
jgi:hypothetical protein